MIIEAASGRMPAYVDTGLNLVHVDSVASGHVAALRHGRIGERYILGGENMTPLRIAQHNRAIYGPLPAARPPATLANLPNCVRRRSHGAGHKARAFHYVGWLADGKASHVFHLG